MLMPKKTKFPQGAPRAARGRLRPAARRAVQFGELRAQGPRRRLDHEPPDRGGPYRDDAQDQARAAKVWINVFPDKSFTKKPAETRMGSGKGSPRGLGSA